MAVISGTVETVDPPQQPQNYIAQAAQDAKTTGELSELLAHAQVHGYSEDGQTVQLLRRRIAELSAKDTPPSRKRGAR